MQLSALASGICYYLCKISARYRKDIVQISYQEYPDKAQINTRSTKADRMLRSMIKEILKKESSSTSSFYFSSDIKDSNADHLRNINQKASIDLDMFLLELDL